MTCGYLTRPRSYVMLTPSRSVSALSLKAAGGFFVPAGGVMPPRPTLQPDDLVTPAQAAELLGVEPNLVRVWIHRHGIEPLGTVGRWRVYDYNEIAAIDASLRRKREAKEAA
jgi:Helix-turn-helix domain